MQMLTSGSEKGREGWRERERKGGRRENRDEEITNDETLAELVLEV